MYHHYVFILLEQKHNKTCCGMQLYTSMKFECFNLKTKLFHRVLFYFMIYYNMHNI